MYDSYVLARRTENNVVKIIEAFKILGEEDNLMKPNRLYSFRA